MKKNKTLIRIVLLLVLLFSVSQLFAQKKEKIKGNKEVVEVFNGLEPFSKLAILDGLEVNIIQSTSEGYHLKADMNLIDVIRFEVVEGTLSMYTTLKITTSKKLEINLTVVSLESIALGKGSKIHTQNKLNFPILNLNGSDGSSFDLDVSSKEFNLEMNGNAQGKLQLSSDNSIMVLNDNAYLKGSISTEKLKLTLNKRADLKIEGNVDDLDLIATGSADIKGKNLKVTNARVTSSNSSDIYLYTSKKLNIYAKGRSNIYVYGNPEIKVDGLNDKSQIIKK